MFGVKKALDKPKKIRQMFWSGRPDLNRRPPAPKVNSKTLSSCLVYVFRACYITVYDGIRRLLFPHCSQLQRHPSHEDHRKTAWVTGRGDAPALGAPNSTPTTPPVTSNY